MALVDLIAHHKIISVIGLAKNTGKTVVVKKLLNELSHSKIRYGITSIGHDGEEFDQINNLIKKPRIHLVKGDLVATTDELIKKSDAEIRIVYNSAFRTSLGKVVIGEVDKEGNVEISGPSTVKSTIEISNLMIKLGAKKVIVDGAINRKAISSPQITNGCIIATGAVLNQQMSLVVKETISSIKSFLLPGLDDPRLLKSLIKEKAIVLVNKRNELTRINSTSFLDENHKLFTKISEEIKCIYCDKSITSGFISSIAKRIKGQPLTVIVSDSTKVFLTTKELAMFERRGVSVKVLFPFNILAITVNPVSPLSHSFNSEELISEFKKNINNIPIIDVLSKHYG